MPSASYGSPSSDSIWSDEEEQEKTTLMEEYQGIATPSEALDEGYASDTPRRYRWRTRMSRTRYQLGKTLQMSKFQSIFASPRLQMLKLLNSVQSFMISSRVQIKLPSFPKLPRRERLQHSLIPFLIFLLPSFWNPWSPTPRPRKLSSMAYLDGLRGVAALLVMIHHYTCQFTPALLEGWGSDIQPDGTNENRWFFQLPFFRVIHSGSFMVVLFFAISGCVLTAKGLKLARTRKRSEFMGSLISSVFRRWLRLHLPVIASMCIALLITRMEWWTHLQPDWLAPPGTPASNTTVVPANGTNVTILSTAPLSAVLVQKKFRAQWDWTAAAKNESLAVQVTDFVFAIIEVCDPFAGGAAPGLQSAGYNAGMILWTIPIEYLGSIVVFATVLGLAWTRTWFKLTMLGFFVCWCHYTIKWHLATFLSGTFIAELTLIKESEAVERNELPTNDLSAISNEKEDDLNIFYRVFPELAPWKTQITTTFWISLFMIGIYIGSIPQINWKESPGFITLYHLVPSWYFAKDLFYPCLGAVFIMLSITYSPHIQSLFLTSFAQYLGRISFSLYLLHTQLLCSLGIRVMSAGVKLAGGGETYFQFAVGMLLGCMVMGPVTFWAAEVFTRGVDEKSVLFARWVASKALVLG